ncbi:MULTISPECIES: ATP-binding protein [Haloarcula]|uniref:ATP-binding protein n=1 Tax=Haloarcula TaxID=2237 RepID=UPI0023EC81F0|nr:ATP-binding protein [Halomicroarcula sp. XH51]
MGRRLNASGLVIAIIGFVLTRFTVALAIYEDPVRFFLAGIAPLALGLGLAAFGVALFVADVDGATVRTTALWCVLGTAAMTVLLVLTVLGSKTADMSNLATIRSQSYLSTFLIGGSVGGTLTGIYAARNRRQRGTLQQQTNRLVILNRILRHEILNALTPLRGFATVDPADHPQAERVVNDRLDDIQQTVEEVKYLVRHAGPARAAGAPVNLEAAIEESVETIEARYPDTEIPPVDCPPDLKVYANDRLSNVFTNLLENAVVHADDQAPEISVTVTGPRVRISVSDRGPGLPRRQRRLLETGDIGEFDDPRGGYGLNVVRLLAESYAGDIETATGESGTEVTVDLARVTPGAAGLRPSRETLSRLRPAAPHLLVTGVSALLAGVIYGVVSELLGGSIAGIGVFYGVANPLVGWITHEFHSVVFGFIFVSLVTLAPADRRDDLSTYVGVGLAWGVVLWAVAASVVGPVWLRLLGIPAPVPRFSVSILVSHVVWGLSLGLLTAWGYRSVVPRMQHLRKRLAGEGTR